MSKERKPPPEAGAVDAARRRRSVILALALAGLMALIYVVSIARMRQNTPPSPPMIEESSPR